jgi:hypothetical protein
MEPARWASEGSGELSGIEMETNDGSPVQPVNCRLIEP